MLNSVSQVQSSLCDPVSKTTFAEIGLPLSSPHFPTQTQDQTHQTFVKKQVKMTHIILN